MGILLCEQNFRDVWRRNKSVRAEIGKILRTHTRGSISSTVSSIRYNIVIDLRVELDSILRLITDTLSQ